MAATDRPSRMEQGLHVLCWYSWLMPLHFLWHCVIEHTSWSIWKHQKAKSLTWTWSPGAYYYPRIPARSAWCINVRLIEIFGLRCNLKLQAVVSSLLVRSTRHRNSIPPGRKLDAGLPLCCSKVWTDALRARPMYHWSCNKCDAHIVNLVPSHERVAIVKVTRFLGRGAWFPDCKECFGKHWYNQCRDLSDYIGTEGFFSLHLHISW